jgi:hypothetical protein
MNMAAPHRSRPKRTPTRLLLAFVLICSGPSCGQKPVETSSYSALNTTQSDQAVQQIHIFCSSCHAMPKPESFPKAAWYDEVKRGFDFYYQSGRNDLNPPPLQTVVQYFRVRAPEALLFSALEAEASHDRLRFRSSDVTLPGADGNSKPAAISFVRKWDQRMSLPPAILFSEMAEGGVYRWEPNLLERPPSTSSCLAEESRRSSFL